MFVLNLSGKLLSFQVLDLRSLYPYHGECVLCSEICTSKLSLNHLIQQIRLHWKSSHANTFALVGILQFKNDLFTK